MYNKFHMAFSKINWVVLHNNELYCHVVKEESIGPTKNPMLIHVLLMIYSILKKLH